MIKSIFFFFFISFQLQSAIKPFVIDKNFDVCSPYMYIEDSSNYTTQQIVELFNSNKLSSNYGNYYFKKGFTTNSYWFIASLNNQSQDTQHLIWSFYNNGIEFTLYELRNGKLIELSKTSMQKPLLKRPFPVRSISFPLELKTNQLKTYFVKATAEPQNNIFFINDITSFKEYFCFETKYSFLIGKYLGFFFLAFIINCIVFFIFKEKIFIINALYILSVILYILSDFQFDSMQISNNFLFALFARQSKEFFVSLVLIFYIVLYLRFTFLKTTQKKVYYFLKLIMIFLTLFSIVSFIFSFIFTKNNYYINLFSIAHNSTTGLGFFTIFSSVIYGAITQEKRFLLFFISSLVLIYGFISFLFLTFDVVVLPNIYPSSVMNGLFIETIFLTSFLVVFYKNERKELSQQLINKAETNEILATQLLKIQTQEKSVIARNLHDKVGNNLLAIRLLLQNYIIKNNISEKEISPILDNIKDTYEIVREISHEIIPKKSENISLIEAIEEKVHFFRDNFKDVEFNFYTDLTNDFQLNKEKEIQIILIINELISNSYKHSKANNLSLQVLENPKEISILVEDNGLGFSLQGKKGIGLINIQARISFLKGTINIDSNLNGTTIIINIPIDENK